jgi:hypothetical protein
VVKYSLALELVPKKCHSVFMANQISNAPNNAWRRGLSDPAVVPGIRAIETIARPQPCRDAKTEAPTDTWIDELQWLAGFPGNWGERRGGWFCGF